jgi:hypothetical protein
LYFDLILYIVISRNQGEPGQLIIRFSQDDTYEQSTAFFRESSNTYPSIGRGISDERQVADFSGQGIWPKNEAGGRHNILAISEI